MIFEKIREIVVDQLGVSEEEVTLESNFTDDLGADSLDTFQLVMGMEEVFGVDIAEEDAEKIKTVADAVKYIEEKTE